MHGKIIRNVRDNTLIKDINTNEVFKAKLKGIFRTQNLKPIVGDNVDFNLIDGTYLITKIHPRKNQLSRPKVCNVDQIFIIQSIKEPDFNSLFIDKLLLSYEYFNIKVNLVITKTDIFDLSSIKEFISYYESIGIKVYNSQLESSFKDFLNEIKNKILVFIGNTGAGKSTLINKIDPNFKIRTQEISKALNRGKHTTTNVNLVDFNDSELIDTPGFGDIEITLTPKEIADYFFINEMPIPKCHFRNCLHLSEQKCFIKDQLVKKTIAEFRYRNYQIVQNKIKEIRKIVF